MASVGKLPGNLMKVYNYLYENQEDGKWSGFGADISEATGIFIKHVYRNITTLEALGCVKRARHGSANSPSIYLILKEPNAEEYDLLKSRGLTTARKGVPTQWQRVQDSINRLNNRITDLELRLARLERDT